MSTTIAKWTVQDYQRMVNAGILDERHVELIEGDIIEMVPEGAEHAGRSESLAMLLRRKLDGRAWIREARPITLTTSEPEPDIAIVDIAHIPYITRHPIAADVFLAIEVSNTTLQTDLTRKRNLYAQAGIPEYWVLDLQHRCVIVFRQPDQITYRQQQTIKTGTIAPLAFADCTVRIEDIFR